MRLAASVALGVAILMFVGGLVMFILGLAGNEPLLWTAGIVVGLLPGVGAFFMYRTAKVEGRVAYDLAIKENFTPDSQGWYTGSGIAADITGGKLLLAAARRHVIVPFDDIVAHWYVAPTARPVGNSQSIFGAVKAIIEGIKAINDYSKAGLFVSVKGDTYRLIGISPSEAERWSKLLAEIKAGTARPSAVMRMRPLDSVR